ncbi:uncharacterized protein PODANS_1_16825 [Podospora anserina S mat+]|uniref:DNA-directed RNA polymerase subunit n=1 Tax=Podospora anserina (strain S / ATCC MYA-4624 / DSM 980 / FGSC 10383) TaxID=515849 RepID=B2ATS7_PODAN|nr:uncharacterized protein PODANS_1_16825 [Podospora anserina S mat+]CAP67800.1 unnamed protein product [Podospora anserina S mat+]CDP24057.1 Putative DNA-directed RNA polymerase III subunit RPC8 [Podospora anserina S mat+]
MWIVTKIADLVQLKPQDFYKTSLEAIEDKINEKYANKVIPNIGLCVCVWDITDASEGLIGQYDEPARVAFVTNRRHSVEAEKVWLWKSDEETQLYYDTHEIVRFMVLEERWYTQPPTKPKESTDSDAPTKTTYQAPYSIIGTMAAPGLGITLWWE